MIALLSLKRRQCWAPATLLLAVGFIAGCEVRASKEVAPAGSWRIVAFDSVWPENRSLGGSGTVPGISIDFEGDPGFTRATCEVEQAGTNGVVKTTLNDVLITVGSRCRLAVSVEGVADEPGVAHVSFRSESGSESSVSVVESKIPLLAPGVQVAFEPLSQKGRRIGEGEEISLARWVIKVGPETVQTTIRVGFSKKPMNPRLRPEAKPPV